MAKHAKEVPAASVLFAVLPLTKRAGYCKLLLLASVNFYSAPYKVQTVLDCRFKTTGRSMNTLNLTKPGTTVRVIRVGGKGPVKRRIMEMGITRDVELYVRKVAPLGDPFEITVRGYELSLRKKDAELIEVEDLLS